MTEAPGAGPKRTAVLTCGALAQDVADVLTRCAWPMDVHGVSAYHHLYPKRIVEDVNAKLEQLTKEYDRVVVLYGDCGTVGALDDVLSKYPVARPAGVNCYEWYVGDDYQRLQDEQPGTYFLTDWLVAHWDQAVIRGLGLDRYPDLKDTYFRHMTHLLFLRQRPDADLLARAEQIAEYLEVPLEVRDTGTLPIERVLLEAISA
jgi:Protein of unknown function (DUF1638)